MEIKFKEVAHLYMGCNVVNINENAFSDLDYLGKRSKLSHLLFDKYVNSKDWKPILRQFKDISKAELMECFDLDGRHPNHKSETNTHLNIKRSRDEVVLMLKNQHNYEFGMGIRMNALSPIIFKYLLSIGIDLFKLIEYGEAINKTKL